MATQFELFAANSRQFAENANGEVAAYTQDGVSGNVVGVWVDGDGGDRSKGQFFQGRSDRELKKQAGQWQMTVSQRAEVKAQEDTLTRGGVTYLVVSATTQSGMHFCECVEAGTSEHSRRDRRHEG